MRGTASFVEHVESYNFGATGGSVVAGTKKICTSAARKPFFGTDTRWEPVINTFYRTRHFGSSESVPHIYFGFHAKSLIHHGFN